MDVDQLQLFPSGIFRALLAGMTFLCITGTAYAYRLSIEDVRVGPLIETRWSQSTWVSTSSVDRVFNLYTPSNAVCGCAVTATAQLMRYYRYPNDVLPPVSNSCTLHKNSTNHPCETLPLTTRGGFYDWSKMPLSYELHPELDKVERETIAKLVSDIGITFGVDYLFRDDETNTSKPTLLPGLKEKWGFRAGYFVGGETLKSPFVQKGEALPDWIQQAIFGSLNARRPVLAWFRRPKISDAIPADGHTVVLDGYGYHDGRPYVHVNCGWGGGSDGWYALMEECIKDRRHSIDYSQLKWFSFNIHPCDMGQVLSGRVTDQAAKPIRGAVVNAKTVDGISMPPCETDENGIYYFVVSNSATFSVSVQKDGVQGCKMGVEMSLPLTVISNSEIEVENIGTIGNRFDVDFVLDIPDSLRSYGITFDLGPCGVQIGGGRLEQSILHGVVPEVPEVRGVGNWRFVGWKPEIAVTTNDMTYVAMLVDDDGDPYPECFVDINAEPGGDGRSFQTALSSLLNGMSQVMTGGVVHVAAGVYPQLRYVKNKPLLVKSTMGKEVTVIDGGMTNRAVQLGTTYVGITNTTLKGFTIRNGCWDSTTTTNKNPAGAGGYAGCYVDCDFTGNFVDGNGAAVYGAVLKNCRVYGNHATGNGGGVGGCEVVDSEVFGNIADGNGGGVYRCKIKRSRIERNISNRGGGAFRSRLEDSIISWNVSTTNTGTSGGGCYFCTNLNCTIFGNTAKGQGGGTSYCVSTNCIIWGNSASNGNLNVHNGICSYCLSTPKQAGDGNIAGDPMMHNPENGDYRLCPGSPCLDAGTNSAICGELDVMGHARVQDAVIDIGACEGDKLTTLSTEIEVPYSWLAKYPSLLFDFADGDYEKAANAETGKMTASGDRLCVWQDYMMGTDPTDTNDLFYAQISISNDMPFVTWSPNLNTNGEIRVYTVFGKTNLTDATWQSPINSAHRFFKVKVEMP